MRRSNYMKCVPLEDIDINRCVPYNFTSSKYFVFDNGEVFEISKDMTEARFLPVVWNQKNEQQLFVDFGTFMIDMDILIYKHFHESAKTEAYEWIEILDPNLKCVDNIRPISDSEYMDITNCGIWCTENFRKIPLKFNKHEKQVKKSGSR